MNQMKVETIQDENEWLWRTGYLWAPSVLAIQDMTGGLKSVLLEDGSYAPCPDEVRDLAEDDPMRIEMIAVLQGRGPMSLDYKDAGLLVYGREPMVDGVIGPATKRLMEMPRCGYPDFEIRVLEDRGQGPWKGCHGIGDGHAVHYQYQNDPPSFMLEDSGDGETVFTKVLRRSRQEDAKIGLLVYYSGPGVIEEFHPPDLSSVQSRASWTRGNGWIGLAIVGNDGLTCTDRIWNQYDNQWASNYDIPTRIKGETLLDLHERGHTKGLGHTNGGIMNPSLRLTTEPTWKGDTAEDWHVRKFSGKPVPIPGPGPGPDPPPPDPDGFDWAKVIAFIIKILLELFKKRQAGEISDEQFSEILSKINSAVKEAK